MLDYANETNLPVGGSTTEFRSDGSGYICNGAIEWDVNGNMKISGNVDIEGQDGLEDDIIAALNVRDISIGSGTTRFFKNGSGWLANHAIQWDQNGNIRIDGDTCLSTSYNTSDITQKNIIYLPSGSEEETVTYGLKCTPESRGKIVIFYNPSPYNGRTYKIRCYSFEYWEDESSSITSISFRYDSIMRPQETLMCTCFQTGLHEYTWEITSRLGQTDFRLDDSMGRYPKCLCTGLVSFNRNSRTYSISSILWNGLSNSLSLSYAANGSVEIAFGGAKKYINPTDSEVRYIPFITVYNGSSNSDDSSGTHSWCGSVTNVHTNGFVVRTGDDDSPNCASFFFALYESSYWVYDLT